MKDGFLALVGTIGASISYLLGGLDGVMEALAVLMVMDYISGLLVAGVFHKSPKSEGGALESRAGWKGLCRKLITLMLVMLAAQLDKLTSGGSFLRDAAAVAFICNEALSILENAGLMGVKYPEALKQALDLLSKTEKEKKNGN